MVIWIIGLSGSGKSFYANKIQKELESKRKLKTIIVDGDDVRKYINYKLGYSVFDRKKNSLAISDLCKFLEAKGFVVICPVLSIFRSHQKRNRKIFENYLQIFIDVKVDILMKRNNKKVYDKKNVVGKNIRFPKPFLSDLIINNSFKNNYKKDLRKILKLINDKKKNKK